MDVDDELDWDEGGNVVIFMFLRQLRIIRIAQQSLTLSLPRTKDKSSAAGTLLHRSSVPPLSFLPRQPKLAKSAVPDQLTPAAVALPH